MSSLLMQSLDILTLNVVPPGYCGAIYDFLSDSDLADFTVTQIGSGTGTIADAASTDYASTLNGVVILDQNANDDNSGAELLLDAAPFGVEAYGEMHMAALFKVTDADQCDLRMGWAPHNDATWIAGVANAIHLRADDGDGIVDLAVIDDSSEVAATGLATLADDTWTIWALSVFGTGTAATQRVVAQMATYNETTGAWTKQLLKDQEFTDAPTAANRGGLSAGFAWHSGAATDMRCYLDKLVMFQKRFPTAA